MKNQYIFLNDNYENAEMAKMLFHEGARVQFGTHGIAIELPAGTTAGRKMNHRSSAEDVMMEGSTTPYFLPSGLSVLLKRRVTETRERTTHESKLVLNTRSYQRS